MSIWNKIKSQPEVEMTPYKFSDLTKEEKAAVRTLAQLSDHEGGWGEPGKEDWDFGATSYKNDRIGLYGPIKLANKESKDE